MTSADLGDDLEFCVTPSDANGAGAQVCSSATTTSAAYSAVANDVTVTGTGFVSSTLTGVSFHEVDGAGLPMTGYTMQWYTAPGGTATAISGATDTTHVPDDLQRQRGIELCVTPPTCPARRKGRCSSPVTVPGVVWYSGESQSGTDTGEATVNGTCVTVSSLDLGFTPASLALYSVDDTVTNIYMYTGSNCTGTMYNRYTGAGTVHDINLDTVGIGSNLVSYKITW